MKVCFGPNIKNSHYRIAGLVLPDVIIYTIHNLPPACQTNKPVLSGSEGVKGSRVFSVLIILRKAFHKKRFIHCIDSWQDKIPLYLSPEGKGRRYQRRTLIETKCKSHTCYDNKTTEKQEAPFICGRGMRPLVAGTSKRVSFYSRCGVMVTPPAPQHPVLILPIERKWLFKSGFKLGKCHPASPCAETPPTARETQYSRGGLTFLPAMYPLKTV